jgi:hypothetical protein
VDQASIFFQKILFFIQKLSVGFLLTKKTICLLVESGLDDGPCCNNTIPGQADDVILAKREN